MEKFILDYSKWRSGGEGPNKIGEGDTKLINPEGFMCCLGQHCLQDNIPKEHIFDIGEPQETAMEIPLLTVPVEAVGTEEDEEIIINTAFSDDAMFINDTNILSPRERLFALKKHYNDAGIQFEAINVPEELNWRN